MPQNFSGGPLTNKIKIARVATVPFSYYNTIDLINELADDNDFEVTVICSEGPESKSLFAKESLETIHINIAREINPLSDFKSVLDLYRIFRKRKFDIVHSHTPKGGLVVSIAAFLARVPKRVHIFTGQRWATLNGFKRKFLIFCDQVIAFLSTEVLTDSHGQREFLIENSVSSPSRIKCLGKGSFAGVNLSKFKPDSLNKNEIRKELNISEKAKVLLFVGRVVNDKGILELVQAFKRLQKDFTDLYLLLVGPFEPHLDPIDEDTSIEIESNSHIIPFGHRSDVEKFFKASEIFCIPSYREGFPIVALQASAMKLPIVGSNIIGVRDSVIDNETGLLCELKNIDELYLSIKKLLIEEEFANQLGENGYQRVHQNFTVKKFVEIMKNYYSDLIKR